MRYRVRTLTAPGAIAPVLSLAEAKKELRVDLAEGEDAGEDALILAKVRSAMDSVERFTGQVLTERELELSLDGFPCLPELIEIPRAPVTAIGSILYSDPSSGAETEWEAPGWRWSAGDGETIRPAFAASWPVAAAERGSVRIAFTAGYAEGETPAALVEAVRKLLVHHYENREAVLTGSIATEMPLGVVELCRPYRRILI